jgi:prophage regulatory protein
MADNFKERLKAIAARIKAERLAKGGLPAYHNLRLPEVEKITGYKRSQIYEKISLNEFPQPVTLSDSGRAVGWSSDEIAAWQEIRIAKRDGEAA